MTDLIKLTEIRDTLLNFQRKFTDTPLCADHQNLLRILERIDRLHACLAKEDEELPTLPLLNSINAALTSFYNAEINQYIAAVVKPTLEDWIERRRAGIQILIKNLYAALFTPQASAVSQSLRDIIATQTAIWEQESREGKALTQVEVFILHQVCKQLLALDLVDKKGIYTTLALQNNHYFPIPKKEVSDFKTPLFTLRKSIIDPFHVRTHSQPVDFSALGDEVSRTVTFRFKQLDIQTTPSAPTSPTQPPADLAKIRRVHSARTQEEEERLKFNAGNMPGKNVP